MSSYFHIASDNILDSPLFSRRPTEKALYKDLTKSAGRIPRPQDSSHAPVIKSEPLDMGLSQFSPSPSMKVKEKSATRFSSPIVISSSESDTSTPKARPAKKDKGPRSAIKLEHMYVQCSLYLVLPPINVGG